MTDAKHVGVIMDGNRRFSKQLMQAPWKGHEWGARKLEDLVTWCKETNVRELTVFALSIQNFSRPKKEFNYLMQLFEKELTDLLERQEELAEDGIRIHFIGRIQLLPDSLVARIQEIHEATATNQDFQLNIAVAYGGREEIVDAAKQLAVDVQEGNLDASAVDEHVFARRLYLQSEPDLIIRTGGEQRTSNFLSWQSTYTEWFFVDELWPAFSKETFTSCLDAYASRERRFGE